MLSNTMNTRDSLKVLPVLAIYIMTCGWNWPGIYSSKLEAVQACSKWVEQGPKNHVNQWEYRIRLRDTSGSSSWDEYGLKLPKPAPKPGEWSPILSAKRKSDIPKPLPNEEVQAWRKRYILPIRQCVSEQETRQLLGIEKGKARTRYKY
jgi:hypothetical protein